MKRFLAVVAALFLATTLSAQKTSDPVLFEIGGQKIHQSEFMKEFLHSIGQDPAAAPTACTYEKRKALEDYVTLFVNYRLKLTDAYAHGLDQDPNMIKELAGYRKELAAPYLIDSASMYKLLEQAYERNKEAVHAAHILVQVSATASPADTLRLYQEAWKVYDRVTKGGEDFTAVAREYEMKYLTPEEQERMESQARGHNGDLGFFTVFNMIYPFENTAYNLKLGEISTPVRTRFGYHIIKLFDRVPYYGNVTLSHIWIQPKDPKGEGKIGMAYKRLQEGMTFDKVAHNYSDDRTTRDKGGYMGSLTMQQLPPDYVSMIGHKALQAGEYSEPFHTEYGWHIIKVIERDTIPPYEDMMSVYRQKLTRDQRNAMPQAVFVEQSKRQYHFVDYTRQYGKWDNGTFVADKKVTKKSRYASSLDELAGQVTTLVFGKKWVFDSTKITNKNPLFEVGGRRYNAVDLGKYIASTQQHRGVINIEEYVSQRYNDYISNRVLQVADDNLERDNEEFRSLMEEYRNGLMIFNYNDEFIWRKSSADSLGFMAFYKEQSQKKNIDNPEDSVYFWGDRARVATFSVSNKECLASDKAVKVITKGRKKGRSNTDIRLDLLEKVDRKQCTDTKPVTFETSMLERINQNVLARDEWKTGTYVHPNGKGYDVVVVEQLLAPMLKSEDEARGYYVSAFQDYVEAQLMQELRKRYKVVIYQDAIDAITY